MYALGTAFGIVWIFKSLTELRGTATQLEGLAEAVEAGQIDSTPPFLYAIYDSRVPPEEVVTFLDKVKIATAHLDQPPDNGEPQATTE